ncbi:MAG: hypothetical protein ACERKD_03620 [Prolixibacteraceae bacterium]
MYKYIIFIFILFATSHLEAQRASRSNWIDFGSSHATKYLQFAAGKMGPNALPVPRMDYATIGDQTKVELGAQYHQMTGDTTVNSYFNWQWNIAPGRAIVEFWGQPSETFRISNDVRDFRQISADDQGWSTEAGDLWISTYIQVLKEKKYWPDIVLNITTKTTTGSNINGRYTDANLNYFYTAIGKSAHLNSKIIDEIRVAGLFGFYVWQVNKVEMAQDEGPVFELGLQIRKGSFNWFNEFGGYTGYDAYEFMDKVSGEDNIQGYNDPLIFRTRIEKAGKHFNYTAEYQTGFRDYNYQTFRLGVIYHFNAKQW